MRRPAEEATARPTKPRRRCRQRSRTARLGGLEQVLGPETGSLVESGDPVQDQNAREVFLSEYEAKHEIVTDEAGRTVLQVGADPWPFPFPLIEENGKWRFDSAEGVEEIVNRRVGRNELFTIQACLAYVDAQREYYVRNPDADPLLHYARRLLSTDGKRDGLYFEVSAGEPESPLGAGFARARDEGYLKEGAPRPEPYSWLRLSPADRSRRPCGRRRL